MTIDELLERIHSDLPDNWQIGVDFYGGGGFDFFLYDSDGVRRGCGELMECGSLIESVDLAISIAREKHDA